MPPIHHIFFRQAGVVTQTFERAALEGLFSAQAAGDAGLRLALHDGAFQMQSGELTLEEYCAQAADASVRLAQSDLGAERAAAAVLGCMRLSVGMSHLLEELAARFDLWLYCEADRAGLLPALLRLGLDRYFKPERWLFSPELEPAALVPATGVLSATGALAGIIPTLLALSQAGLDELLWVDDRSLVTSAAIRAGLHAVAYVDPFRLRRNLVLRGLIGK